MIYKTREPEILILKPDPIIYGGRSYEIKINVIMEEFLSCPVQLAAIYRLQKIGLWHEEIKNPLGELMLIIFNDETPDKLNYSIAVRDDLEQMVYELSRLSARETNNFLFETTEKDKIQQEQIAAELLGARDDDQLREILIAEVLFDAMGTNLENWPPGPIHDPKKDVTTKSEGIYLTKYARMLKTHLESEHPEMLKELQENGTLNQFLDNRQNRAIELIDHLMDQGMNSSEAQEIAISQLLALVTDDE
ncbi:hypothetical protein [Maribellus sediminis]|uniref:hypothetical protein n=1 Tax=Maribellus sediminis TaxID=2696285 RepID=UPI001431C29C|nr:hypothetical protein [Maribellus sediminis]